MPRRKPIAEGRKPLSQSTKHPHGKLPTCEWLPFDIVRLAMLVWCGMLALAASPAARAQQPPGLQFVAEPVDGEPVSGRLVSIEKSWRITLRTPADRPFDGAELVNLRRREYTPVVGPSGSQVLLVNGDRIRAIAQRSTQDSLRVNSELLGDLEIPLERVQALLLSAPADTTEREQLVRRLAQARHKQDAVILMNGDQSVGTLLALDDTVVRLDTAQGPIEVQRAGVRAIVLSSELASFPRPNGLYAQTVLADGSELLMLDGRLDGANFRGRAAWGHEVTIPIEQLVGLEFRNGRLTYLSDLEPAGYCHTPYLNIRYSFERDRSVLGNAISLRGQVFRKGIGMHSRSEISYSLDGRFRRFKAVVGIDDETTGLGSATFRVLVDGEQAWERPTLTGRSASQPVSVPLERAKRLTLVVDFADQGDVQDHADWADARLVQ